MDELPSRWTAIDRARHDVAMGRLWKARDRLNGYIGFGNANDDDAFALLAEVYFAMGDLPKAGGLWYLMGRDDDDARAAIEAWRARCGGEPSAMARSLRSQVPPTASSEARFQELWRAGGAPRIRRDGAWIEQPDTLRNRMLDGVIIGTVIMVTVGVWLIGITAIVWFLTR